MANFSGKLNSNKVCSGIYNMIISQYVFADNIKGVNGGLVDKFRVDGTLFGDTKLYYATDILKSTEWTGQDTNVLETNRPPQPKCQAIVMDKFRQVAVTIDRYLSKQAWSTEGAFGQFVSVILASVKETKRVYDATLFNSFVGTHASTAPKANVSVQLAAGETEEDNRKNAQLIAKEMAKLLKRLQDPSRDYNEYGFLRSYNDSDLVAIWNEDAVIDITKMDVPTIFHKDGLVDKLGEYTLPARYFGTILSVGGTSNGTQRSLVERDYNTPGVSMDNSKYDVKLHIFPGDIIPNGETYNAKEAYTPDNKVLFKLIHKDAVPFMSAFSVETSFNNPRALLENHYLTFGHNTLEALLDKPFITVKQA